MSNDAQNDPVYACRLTIQDVGTPAILANTDYLYFLKLENGDVQRAAIRAAMAILFRFSQLVEERIGELEFHGNQAASAYRDALKLFITNPNFSVALNGAMPYAGGISKSDIAANLDDPDVMPVDITRSLATESDLYTPYFQDYNPYNKVNRQSLF